MDLKVFLRCWCHFCFFAFLQHLWINASLAREMGTLVMHSDFSVGVFEIIPGEGLKHSCLPWARGKFWIYMLVFYTIKIAFSKSFSLYLKGKLPLWGYGLHIHSLFLCVVEASVICSIVIIISPSASSCLCFYSVSPAAPFVYIKSCVRLPAAPVILVINNITTSTIFI